jgi:uncharacterized protein
MPDIWMRGGNRNAGWIADHCLLSPCQAMTETPTQPAHTSPGILVDADACPVKEEIYKVAWRRGVPVVLVSNARFRIPDHPLITRHIVSDAFDAADDWIAEQAGPRSIVITADILLADRCLKAGAVVIGNNGKPFTTSSIGGALATRAIMADLRAGMDGIAGGPAPFAKADRSRFLQALDEALVRLG